MSEQTSEKSWIVALLTCWFLGYLGIHRFYAGKPISGLIQLCTGGGLGVWWIIDCVRILLQRFDDGDGRIISK